LAGDDNIVPTNDWSGKGGESRRRRERRRSHDSVRQATTIARGRQQCNNQPTARATKVATAAVIVIIIAAVTVAVAVAAVVVIAVFAVAVAVAVAIDAAVSSVLLLVDCCMCLPPSMCHLLDSGKCDDCLQRS
jgi:Flp pilus assembly protein TadB